MSKFVAMIHTPSKVDFHFAYGVLLYSMMNTCNWILVIMFEVQHMNKYNHIYIICTAPESPSYLTAEILPQEPGSFRVSWTPPASSANLTGYHIYYSGANDSGSRDVGASATNITIDNHMVGVTYTITMVAVSPHLPSPAVIITLPGENFASKKDCVA